MAKEQYKIPFFVACVLCGLLAAIVLFGLRKNIDEYEYTFDRTLEQYLSQFEKIVIGNVTVTENGILDNCIFYCKETNDDGYAIMVDSNARDTTIMNCLFKEIPQQYELDILLNYVDLFDRVTLIDYKIWYSYDKLWEVEFWGEKNGIEYKFKIDEEKDLNIAIKKIAKMIEERMKECNNARDSENKQP